MIYQKALNQIKDLIQQHFSDHLNPNRIYHNLQDTETVVARTLQIASDYKLDSKSLFIIQAAAWFHEAGYADDPAHAEKKSARLAERLLTEISVNEEVIKSIRNCILASTLPQKPQNLLEEIVCDAVMSYLGSEDFSERSKLMRKEHTLLTGKKISKDEWKRRNMELLQNHRFKTEYGKQLFENQQRQNLERLLGKDVAVEIRDDNSPDLREVSTSNPAQPDSGADTIQTKKHLSDSGETSKVEDKKRPSRGIETMFRISSNNHQALSQMADSKAHIMITVNSIIISVLLSVLFRSIDEEEHLAIPVAILLIVNVVTIVFSILATRPNIPTGKFSEEDLNEQRVNLLFFGNFYKMQLEDFATGMTRLMENRNFLYSSLIKNLHQQGLVLGKKYRLLRISYNVFMYGLVLSLFAFGLAILIKML
ncbi:phosphohydrolase [Flavihumibacter sp. R14]|nr:phosphohydrolase [Flavihumibacter soli]